MNTGHVIDAVETFAPPAFAEPWDNVGLLIGSRAWPVEHVLLTIDLTDQVLDEAVRSSAQMIIAYHPAIFEPIRSLNDETPRQRIALYAAANGIAVYSPHTALDAAPGGINDWLADGLGGGDVRALASHQSVPPSEAYKVVTFCPTESVDQLRNALASVGAGHIGEYGLCSFEAHGRGTFMGGDDTSPAIGKKGQFERVEEVRLEMVCPQAALGLAMLALREFHPYEEPSIEIYHLEDRPDRDIGQGRRVVLDQKATLREMVDRIKQRLGVSQVRVASAVEPPRRYGIVGLCAGAGAAQLDAAIDQHCEMFITGEMRHHTVIDAQARNCTVVLAGHSNTERGYLKELRKRLADDLPETKFSVSRRDADPLRVM